MNDATRRTGRRGSTVTAAAWMVGLSIALFWLPIAGPFIAGFVGGRRAGTIGRAMVAAFAPAVILAVVVVAVLAAFELPIIGAVAGIGVALVILAQDIPLFLGAWLGAVVTDAR